VKIDFAVLCDYALIDQFGKLSVLGIFEHIWVPKFPAVHPRLHLVMRLKGRRTELGKHEILIRLVDDENEEIISSDGTVDFSEPPAGVLEIEAGTVLVFDVPFSRPGRYEFFITVDNTIECSMPLTVGLAPSSPAAEASELP
jgi:hypothetical protein